MLAGMAQLNVKAGFVSAVLDTDCDIELAGGGHYNAAALRSEILKLIAAGIGIIDSLCRQILVRQDPWRDLPRLSWIRVLVMMIITNLLQRIPCWTARTGSRIGPHTAISRYLREEPAFVKVGSVDSQQDDSQGHPVLIYLPSTPWHPAWSHHPSRK